MPAELLGATQWHAGEKATPRYHPRPWYRLFLTWGLSMAERGTIRLDGSFAEESGRLPADGLDDRVHLTTEVQQPINSAY